MKRIVLVGGLLVALSVGGVSWAQEGQFVFAFRAAPELPAPDLNLNCVEDDGPRWPAGSDAIAGAPGTVARAAYYCTLEQLDPCVQPNPTSPLTCELGTPGAQGWQMVFTASGCDAIILAVTATQTDVAPGSIEECERGPGGSGGFDRSTVARGNKGALHAILLHLKNGTTLDPGSINFSPSRGAEENPATTCRFLVEYTTPDTTGQSCDMTLQYVDGLFGSGQPLDNKAQQNGQALIPTLVEKTVRVIAGPVFQVPGDCNQDGALDIADAVCIVGALFRGNPPELPCGNGSSTDPGNIALLDWQPDGAVDVSDVVGMLDFLFRALEPHPLAVPGVETTGCVGIASCPDNSTGCP